MGTALQLQIILYGMTETFLCAGHAHQILVNMLLCCSLCAGHVRHTAITFHTGKSWHGCGGSLYGNIEGVDKKSDFCKCLICGSNIKNQSNKKHFPAFQNDWHFENRTPFWFQNLQQNQTKNISKTHHKIRFNTYIQRSKTYNQL